jgi:signal transduction histidine kinase
VATRSRVPAGNTDDVRTGSQLLAALLLRDVERIAQDSAARMQELLPAYARVPLDELIPVVLANTRNLLEAIRDPDTDRNGAETVHRASGEARARQGITSDEMLNAWRIGLENVREEAHLAANELGISTDALLDFVVATLRLGDIGMRTSATAHHEAEIRELGRLVQEQAALRRVATLVVSGRSSEQVLAKVAEEVGVLLQVEAVAIHRYEADGHSTVVAQWGELADAFPVGKRFRLDGENVTTLVSQTERPVRLDSYEHASGSIGAYARHLGTRCAAGGPIVVNGRLWGAIVATTLRAGPLPVGTEWRIAEFTEMVATAISNIQARAEVERLADEQAALRRVATMVAHERSPEDVFAAVAEDVGLLLGADVAVIHRFEPAGDATVVGSWGKLDGAFRVASCSKLDGESVTASIFRTGRSARFDGYRWASGSIAAQVRRLGLCSSVGSPIVVTGRLWGVLGLATSRPEPLPADAEARVANFTELVATAIANIQARSDLAASRARVVAAADDERRRVVRDLHDGAQQRLVHTILTLKLAEQALAGDGPEAQALVAEALAHAETANEELRELAHGILPSVLTHGGLRAGVRALAARMAIPVAVEVAPERLPAVVEATAYFIAAEALTNVAKHAQARSAAVAARVADGALELEVSDDGIGGADPDGSGLVGLRDRLAALDGTLRVESPAGGGTRIAASIPVRRN